MSSFAVEVVLITEKTKHENADSLSVTNINGNPVVFKSDGFNIGDKAVYVPVESVVPVERPEFAFLKHKLGQTTERIKAKRLRGVYSEGLLIPCTLPDANIGDDVKDLLGVVKYEEVPRYTSGGREVELPEALKSSTLPVYDIEAYQKPSHKACLILGEEVSVTEKRHGTNARFLYKDNQLFVGSHRTWKEKVLSEEPNEYGFTPKKSVYWAAAEQHGLAEKLAKYPGYIFYGEVFGYKVQDLQYGAKAGELFLEFFDIFDTNTSTWVDWVEAEIILKDLNLPIVPELYRGPFDPNVVEPLRFGLDRSGSHIREGFVIKPIKYRYYHVLGGRVILKYVSEDYKLRKNPLEGH